MERTSRNEAINSTFLAAWDSLSKIATTAPLADTEDVFKSAFSSQIGQLTVLLLNRWIATAPKRGSGLQPEVRERLVALLGKPDPASRVARVMTAAHLYALHFVDRTWTVSALIPLFDWSTSSASEMWQGYLFNARWYPDLLADLKPSLLVAFGKGNQLGEAAKRLWRVLADIATYAPSSLSDRELGDSLQSLRKEDLAFIGLSFDQILARAEVSERPSLWERGISRALRLWPLDKQLRSEELSGSLMAIAVHEQDLFEQVASSIEHLLAPVKNIQTILYHLCKTKLPETHPNTVARLLSLVIDPHGTQPHLDTDACQLLLRLKTAEPSVGQMFEFEKLARTGWFDV
jgi:hypothetical protein